MAIKDKQPSPTRHVYRAERGRTVQAAYQLRAELLLHPLLVTGVHSWVSQVPNSLGDEQVETVFHCKHEQRPVQRNGDEQEPKRSARSSCKVKDSEKGFTQGVQEGTLLLFTFCSSSDTQKLWYAEQKPLLAIRDVQFKSLGK